MSKYTTEEKQVLHLQHLMQEFYSTAKVYDVDLVEERVYFIVTDLDGSDFQAVVDRENEVVKIQYKEEGSEDWYLADSVTFEKVNEVNEVPIF